MYVCAGDSCDQCKLRFHCFTEVEQAIFEIDWIVLHKEYGGSPTYRLQTITGGKIHVAKSKEYVRIVESLHKWQWEGDRAYRNQHPRIRIVL